MASTARQVRRNALELTNQGASNIESKPIPARCRTTQLSNTGELDQSRPLVRRDQSRTFVEGPWFTAFVGRALTADRVVNGICGFSEALTSLTGKCLYRTDTYGSNQSQNDRIFNGRRTFLILKQASDGINPVTDHWFTLIMNVELEIASMG